MEFGFIPNASEILRMIPFYLSKWIDVIYHFIIVELVIVAEFFDSK